MNNYFQHLIKLISGTKARAEDMNSRFDALETAFDKLPAPNVGSPGFTVPVTVGDAVLPGQACTAAQAVAGGLMFANDTGAANAYVVTLAVAPAAYTSGMMVSFKASNANTGASTINVNGLGIKTLYRSTGAACLSGDIALNQVVTAVYNGTSFQATTSFATQLAASETACSGSATTATTQAGIATTKASESSASASASETSRLASGVSATNSEASKVTAVNSAAIATTQAGIATTKAGEAGTSATNAAASASSATSSATSATASKNAAATSETNAAASATSASGSATNAATKAGEASTSATNAATKAGEASTSATNAAASTLKAGDWAEKATEVETGKYSAKYWADAAVATLESKVDKVSGKGLSTEDYTTEEKSKLAGIAEGAQVNVATNLTYVAAATTGTIVSSDGTDAIIPAATPSLAGLQTWEDKANLDTLMDIFNILINSIGTPASAGFGKGICPRPGGFTPLPGYAEPLHDNYGDYQYPDGSIMGWIPKFWYRIGHTGNPTYGVYGVNSVDIKGTETFASTAAANTAGYALHRAFIDGGVEKDGVFVDKFQCSNNNGVASSVKNGKPLSSAADHNPFSGLDGAPTNAYHGAIVAAKTRGPSFFCCSRFIFSALALLSLAHGQAATTITNCAWLMVGANFPKGDNNNALKDTNDTTVTYTTDGYSNCGLTGSGLPFAKTTHNGQACGVADLNGNMWEVSPGITSNATNFYLLKTSARMKDVTAGNTLATDLWGATGIAALYDSLGATYEALTASSTTKLFGSTSQVLSAAVSGNGWNAAGAGIPLVGGTGGSNLFGSDGLYDYGPDDMCPIAGGDWGFGGLAGVWALALLYVRGGSANSVGFRAALYL
jgi:hypothetical protein